MVELFAPPQTPAADVGAAQAAACDQGSAEARSRNHRFRAGGRKRGIGRLRQQTWPYLSRVCMDEYRSKNRPARVISTDKLDKPTVTAIEAQPPTAAETKPAVPALCGSVRDVCCHASPRRRLAVVTASAPAEAAPSAPAAASPAPAAEPPTQAAATAEPKERQAKKSKAKTAAGPAETRRGHVACANNDDGDDRITRRTPRAFAAGSSSAGPSATTTCPTKWPRPASASP